MTTSPVATAAPPLLTAELLQPLLGLGGPLSMPIADSMPLVLRLLSKLLETRYQVKTRALTLSEKNKGGDYHSAGFGIDTDLIETDTPAAPLYQALLQHPFSLHGLSVGSLETAYAICPQAFARIAPPDEHILAGNPLADNQQAIDLKGTPLIVTYEPLKATLLHATPEFTLNDWHKTLYHSYVTKWYEHSANPTPVHATHLATERHDLTSRYELFLCTVLTQYFQITVYQ